MAYSNVEFYFDSGEGKKYFLFSKPFRLTVSPTERLTVGAGAVQLVREWCSSYGGVQLVRGWYIWYGGGTVGAK